MAETNEIGILSCPLCGSNFCQIFYGFSLIYPNFDNPKRFNIELKYICSQNDNKMSSIELSRYLNMIYLNSKFNNNSEIEQITNNIKMEDINEEELSDELKKISNNINDILVKIKDINISNKDFVNNYINENSEYAENIKYFLYRYNELNDELYSFINIFLKNIRDYKGDNLKISFLYMQRALDYFEFMKNKNLYLKRELIEKFINSKDIMKMPFLVELNKGHIPSRHKEMLNGHTLPVVGLTQMKNGLILSGSYGLLKIWKKNSDINSDNYSFFELFHTEAYDSHLIQCFIELEENTIAFSKGKQIIESKIDKDGPIKYKELFQYQVAENSIESLTSINNNKNLVAGLYQKMYIYDRKNPSPIYTLQYHEFFIKKIISIPKLNLFCSAGTDHKVILYNAEKFEFFSVFNFEESHIVCLCNYKDTDFCASTMGGKIWYFKWDEKINNHEQIGPINAHKNEIYGITQIKNGNIVSASRDGSIKFWDINKLVCIYKIDVGANDHIIQLKDGRLCSASNNHTISIYNSLPPNINFDFFSLEN